LIQTIKQNAKHLHNKNIQTKQD